MKNRLLHYFSYLTMGVTLIFIIVIFFWLNYPYKILEFKDKKFPVLTKTVKRGGVLQYVSRYCKYMDIPAKLTRSFVNGFVFSTPPIQTNRDCGCNEVIISVPVPSETPVGIQHIQNLYDYEPNPIRHIYIKQISEDFIVE